MKKFIIGLNLDANEKELQQFYKDNSNILRSVYFSLPLGKQFYSRRGLISEYKDSSDKLVRVLKVIKDCGIKQEVTFNTKLRIDDIKLGIEFMQEHGIEPDEITCLNSSVATLKKVYPNAEFISSYCNGSKNISNDFESVVLGQSYLREKNRRHEFIDNGFKIILLLNNGCSYQCNPQFCDSKICPFHYESSSKSMTSNEIYAIQSFFPKELENLIKSDSYASEYCYKISNRTMGLEYTKKALKAYSNFLEYTPQHFKNNPEDYALFGALHRLCAHIDEYDYQKIMEIKKQLSTNYI